jgi:hypothetical protein
MAWNFLIGGQATERSGPSGPGPSYRYARGVPAGQPWRGIPGDGG